MPYRDLRAYIEKLGEEGEVQRIEKEVDWDMEVGAIIRRSYDLKAPAPFFQKIKDYPRGYRIFGAPLGTSRRPGCYFARMALTMDMRPDATAVEIIEEYIQRRKNLIKPVLVTDGPCKEVILKEDEVDLFKFPAPILHGGDGGRYLGTWHCSITKDPDTGWINWGMYRLMIHDKNTLGGIIAKNAHIGLHYYQKYESRGRPMEFAIAIGPEPVCTLIAASRQPIGVNEADVVGAIRREPIELIKCETVDLMVPASAEIVLEGVVNPNERRDEGPFGEYTGYRVAERAPRPVYHVRCITHRKDPILTSSCMGVPVDDNAPVSNLTGAAGILDDLRTRGYPVRMVYRPMEAIHMTIVSTKVPYPNYVQELASAVWSSNAQRSWGYLVIVDDDVDVTNMEEVLWAITTRCHPERGIHKFKSPGSELTPYASLEERRNLQGASVLMDCTWPKDWPEEAIPVKASFDVMWPKEIQQKVLKSWKEYGYE